MISDVVISIYNGYENIVFDEIPKPRPSGAPDVWERR